MNRVNIKRHSNNAFECDIEINGVVSDHELHRLFEETDLKLERRMDIDPFSFWFDKLIVKDHNGLYPMDDADRMIQLNEPLETVRRDMVSLLLKHIIDNDIQGDFVECGVYKGEFARFIHNYAPERTLHLFDTFQGFTQRVCDNEKKNTGWSYAPGTLNDDGVDVNSVLETVGNTENVKVYPGYFPDTFPDNFPEELDATEFAFVHLDTDMYDSILAGLEIFYNRMLPGGIILVHDYMSLPGAHKAVNEFLKDKPEFAITMPDRAGSALIVVQ
jgi:O-methyltransferase